MTDPITALTKGAKAASVLDKARKRLGLKTQTEEFEEAVDADFWAEMEKAADGWNRLQDKWSAIPEEDRPTVGELAALLMAAKRVHGRSADPNKRAL